MKAKTIIEILIISGLVGACGSVAENSVASLDENATTIQAVCASSDLGTVTKAEGGKGRSRALAEGGKGRARALTEGGKGRFRALGDNSFKCSSYLVEFFGTCNNCDSVLVETNGEAFTVSVDENNAFSYSFNTSTLDEINLTPLSF